VLRYDKDSDAALVAQAKGQDVEAFDALVRRHRDFLFRSALRQLDDPEAALDCVQETWLRAYESLPRFRGECSFTSWLYRTLEHVCSEERRRQARWARNLVTADEAHIVDVETVVGQRDDVIQALRAVAELPLSLRATALLSLVEGLGSAEAAGLLDITVQALRMRLSRARALLAAAAPSPDGLAAAHTSLAEGYHLLGRLLLRRGRTAASDKMRLRALALDPETAYSLWTGQMLARGTPLEAPAREQAIRVVEQAVARWPDAGMAIVALGNMRYWEQHDYREAERLYRSMVTSPTYAGLQARGLLAHVYSSTGRPRVAAPILHRLIAEAGDTGDYDVILLALSLTLCRESSAPRWVRRAEEVARRGIPGPPTDRAVRIHTGNLRFLTAELLEMRGNRNGAAKHVRAALRAFPSDYPTTGVREALKRLSR